MSSADLPIGPLLPGWTVRAAPPRTVMQGRFCWLEPLSAQAHAADLFAANSLDVEGRNWTYLSIGPFADFDTYRAWVSRVETSDDPLFFAIMDADTSKAVGVAALMRVDRANGTIEVGNINYSPLLQRQPAATEAMFLLMRRVFDELGYRRLEWKCDSLNAASRKAAQRLGFMYEGLFRQAVVYKGRNRDTAWFSIVDVDWPALKAVHERWLAPGNFDADGRQKLSLRQCSPRND
jgi:RimJ/RimL family protein N-acetyltransferase